jgi:hypothetical protein
MTLRALFNRLGRESLGSMVIEMAAIAPVLVLMSIGTFEISRMVSRQQELQSAASESETIALAAAASGEVTDLTTVEDIIETSMNLDDDQVTVERYYRCDADEVLVTAPNAASACSGGEVVTSYMKLSLTDSYTPVWTQFGIGSAFDYDVERMVQL